MQFDRFSCLVFRKGSSSVFAPNSLIRYPSYGRVEVDRDGRILQFDEKGGGHGPGWVNAGVYIFNRDLLKTTPLGKPFSLEKEFFHSLIGKGLYGFQSEGAFIDIGTPESYAMAEDFFFKVSS